MRKRAQFAEPSEEMKFQIIRAINAISTQKARVIKFHM